MIQKFNSKEGTAFPPRPMLRIGRGIHAEIMKKALPRSKEETSQKDGAKIITDLFQRRNAIAHQNDRSHASAEQNDITKEFVKDYISKIKTIVNAIHSLAEDKELHP